MYQCFFNQRLWLVSALVGLLLHLASPAWAGVDSVEDHYYPSVQKLEKTQTGIRAFLGRKFLQTGKQGLPTARPIVQYSLAEGWKSDQPYLCKDTGWVCIPSERQGESPLPPIALSRDEAIALRPSLAGAEVIEQKASAWTDYGGFTWFGIGFYDGEGTSGAGGVGRYNPKTQRTEIHRPHLLRDSSVGHIVHDGEILWLSTVGNYELSKGSAHGLVRYEWNTDRIETFEGKDDGPCGFMVNDLLLDRKYLWVATDLGMSRWDRKERTWDHYMPDPGKSPPMRTITCSALYTNLLKILPRSYQPSFDTIPYSALFQSVKAFRPRFLTSYAKAMPSMEWRCDELKFLAEGIQDLRTLKADLLNIYPLSSPFVTCALEGFRSKHLQDTEWRDLLVAVLEGFGEAQHHDRGVVLYPLLQNFPGDQKIGEALARRIKTSDNPWREAEMLPMFLGDESVPYLIAALDRFNDSKRHNHIVRAVVGALMQATHVFISQNGVITSVPPNVKPDKYQVSDKALPRVTVQWKKWWEAHKAEYGAGLARTEPKQSEKGIMGTAKVIEPRVTLSASTSTVSIGTVYTLVATVKNLADPAIPSLVNFPLRFQVIDGPHADLVTPLLGLTDSKGALTFNYSGVRSGKDKITVTHEGDESFMEEAYAEVIWGGPDLVVPLFIPPVLMSEGGKTFFITDWTENIGSFPATASTTRYFLSATNPANPAKARVVGERTVPALRPGERSDVRRQPFVLPNDLAAGTYYLAACADADGKDLETDEQNNCSFHKLPGQAVISAPSISIEQALE